MFEYNCNGDALRSIFSDRSLGLPICWDGKNFLVTLESLYKRYCHNVCCAQEIGCGSSCEVSFNMEQSSYRKYCSSIDCFINRVKQICNEVVNIVREYLNGYPGEAYNKFCELMNGVIGSPIKVYKKTGWIAPLLEPDPLSLFRVVKVEGHALQPCSSVFHVPFDMRTKVGTNRYSIAGFPSLYLGTSIKLCLTELGYNGESLTGLVCSRFKINRNANSTPMPIEVIEMGIKPQDFFLGQNAKTKLGIELDLSDFSELGESYLLWYPIIAASSFVRADRNHPFAPEYIIPQLLMQWAREKSRGSDQTPCRKLYGFRYFSCASLAASELGFNYVFPTGGEGDVDSQNQDPPKFCDILTKSFYLTKPVYIQDHQSIDDCERFLKYTPDIQLRCIDEWGKENTVSGLRD